MTAGGYILHGGGVTRAVGPEMVLAELDLPYELRPVDIAAGEHRRDWFRRLNPAGYVPALVTPEGEVLHEAAAIMLYLWRSATARGAWRWARRSPSGAAFRPWRRSSIGCWRGRRAGHFWPASASGSRASRPHPMT